MDALIGAGGWGYFDVPGRDSLAAYAAAFPFVEVNATFYETPDPRTVAAWRRRVPSSFAFAVRASRELTHRYRVRPPSEARGSFARTARIAERLHAVAVVLETPASVRFDAAKTSELEDLIASADLPCPLALEARAHAGHDLPSRLAAVMAAGDVSDVVDFSRQAPRTESSLAYGRMFGLGDGNRWEFTDEELTAVRIRGEATGAKRVAYAFHGVRMYKDSGRFLTYVRTGRFPRTTRRSGIASLEEVLSEDAEFPATKASLLRDHGFRVVDGPNGRTVHARQLLERLPAGSYPTARSVTERLAAVLGRGPAGG